VENGASAAACAIGVSPVSKCDLCELRDYTQRYCEFVHPFKFTILDCDSCDTPMAVLGEHRTAATEAEKALMVEVLSTVARDKWGSTDSLSTT
jgi:hypothetical protein